MSSELQVVEIWFPHDVFLLGRWWTGQGLPTSLSWICNDRTQRTTSLKTWPIQKYKNPGKVIVFLRNLLFYSCSGLDGENIFRMRHSFWFEKKSKELNLGLFSVIDVDITYLSEEGWNRLNSSLWSDKPIPLCLSHLIRSFELNLFRFGVPWQPICISSFAMACPEISSNSLRGFPYRNETVTSRCPSSRDRWRLPDIINLAERDFKI
jgi:hypothetical protein